jgi:hypothetical protein
MSASATFRERLGSAAAAIALQAGLLALLVLSFEVVRRVAPEEERFITLPPLARPETQPAPVVIDARKPPNPGGTSTTAPPLSLPAYALPSFSLGPPAGATALQALNRDLVGCALANPRDTRTAAPCPPLTVVARPDPNDIPLTDRPVKNAPIWQAGVDRRNAPKALPGGDPLGTLLTLLFNPEAFLDKRSYSYATPQGPVSGADHLHDMITNNPICLSGAGASAAEQCMRDAGSVTMHRVVALGVPPPSGPHVSDSAFQQALAATQARTRALYGRPVLASGTNTGDGDAKDPASGNSRVDGDSPDTAPSPGR